MMSQIFELSSRFYQFIIVLQSVSLHRGNRHIHRSHCGYKQVCQHDEEVLETRRQVKANLIDQEFLLAMCKKIFRFKIFTCSVFKFS